MADKTYFIRTRNRLRILATLVTRVVDGNRLAFAWAVSSAYEISPSRAEGRRVATERLEAAIKAWKENGTKAIHPFKRYDRRSPDKNISLAGVLEFYEVLPVLYHTLEHYISIWPVPKWAYHQETDNHWPTEHFPEYLELFCKIRNELVNTPG